MPCKKLGGGLGPGTDLMSRNNLTDIRPTDCHQRTRRRSWRVIFGSGCPENREKCAKPPDDFGRERPAGVLEGAGSADRAAQMVEWENCLESTSTLTFLEPGQ